MIRSKSKEDADFLPTILGKFISEVINGFVPVVLFGAGSAGKELSAALQLHGVNPTCFCDNNSSRSGQLYCGLPIISLPELILAHKGSLILITTGTYAVEVKAQLVDLGFDEERLLSISSPEAMYYYTHFAQWYWHENDLKLYKDDFVKVYNLLSDQKSKDIFVSRIALFVNGADCKSFLKFISELSEVDIHKNIDSEGCADSFKCTSEAYLQFNNDLIHLDDNEVLIDGGAFTGDSTQEFISACTRNKVAYRNIVCYEPDPAIFAQLKVNTGKYRNIALRPFGLWSHSATLTFADSSIFMPGSTRIVSASEYIDDLPNIASGVSKIITTSIDEDLSDCEVTIIKMDIEGAEIEALRGSIKTIQRYLPKLIISAYHKRNDLFEIPLLIHQFNPSYKLYLRHFSGSFNETTLLATA